MKTLGFCQPKDLGNQSTPCPIRLAAADHGSELCEIQDIESKDLIQHSEESESVSSQIIKASVSKNRLNNIKYLNGLVNGLRVQTVLSNTSPASFSIATNLNECSDNSSLIVDVCVPECSTIMTEQSESTHNTDKILTTEPTQSSLSPLSPISSAKFRKRPSLECLVAKLHHRADESDTFMAGLQESFVESRPSSKVEVLFTKFDNVYLEAQSFNTANTSKDMKDSLILPENSPNTSCNSHGLDDQPNCNYPNQLFHGNIANTSVTESPLAYPDDLCNFNARLINSCDNFLEDKIKKNGAICSNAPSNCSSLLEVDDEDKQQSCKVLDANYCSVNLGFSSSRESCLKLDSLHSVDLSVESNIALNLNDVTIKNVINTRTLNKEKELNEFDKKSTCSEAETLDNFAARKTEEIDRVYSSMFNQTSNNNHSQLSEQVYSVDEIKADAHELNKDDLLSCHPRLINLDKNIHSPTSVSKSSSNTPMFSETPSDASQNEIMAKISDAVAALFSRASEQITDSTIPDLNKENWCKTSSECSSESSMHTSLKLNVNFINALRDESLSEPEINTEPILNSCSASVDLGKTEINAEPIPNSSYANADLGDMEINSEPILNSCSAVVDFSKPEINAEPLLNSCSASVDLSKPEISAEHIKNSCYANADISDIEIIAEPILNSCSVSVELIKPGIEAEPILNSCSVGNNRSNEEINAEPISNSCSVSVAHSNPEIDAEPIFSSYSASVDHNNPEINAEPILSSCSASVDLIKSEINAEPLLNSCSASVDLSKPEINAERIKNSCYANADISDMEIITIPILNSCSVSVELIKPEIDAEPILNSCSAGNDLSNPEINAEPILSSYSASVDHSNPEINAEPILSSCSASVDLSKSEINAEPIENACYVNVDLCDMEINAEPFLNSCPASVELSNPEINAEPILNSCAASVDVGKPEINTEPILNLCSASVDLSKPEISAEPYLNSCSASTELSNEEICAEHIPNSYYLNSDLSEIEIKAESILNSCSPSFDLTKKEIKAEPILNSCSVNVDFYKPEINAEPIQKSWYMNADLNDTKICAEPFLNTCSASVDLNKPEVNAEPILNSCSVNVNFIETEINPEPILNSCSASVDQSNLEINAEPILNSCSASGDFSETEIDPEPILNLCSSSVHFSETEISAEPILNSRSANVDLCVSESIQDGKILCMEKSDQNELFHNLSPCVTKEKQDKLCMGKEPVNLDETDCCNFSKQGSDKSNIVITKEIDEQLDFKTDVVQSNKTYEINNTKSTKFDHSELLSITKSLKEESLTTSPSCGAKFITGNDLTSNLPSTFSPILFNDQHEELKMKKELIISEKLPQRIGSSCVMVIDDSSFGNERSCMLNDFKNMDNKENPSEITTKQKAEEIGTCITEIIDIVSRNNNLHLCQATCEPKPRPNCDSDKAQLLLTENSQETSSSEDITLNNGFPAENENIQNIQTSYTELSNCLQDKERIISNEFVENGKETVHAVNVFVSSLQPLENEYQDFDRSSSSKSLDQFKNNSYNKDFKIDPTKVKNHLTESRDQCTSNFVTSRDNLFLPSSENSEVTGNISCHVVSNLAVNKFAAKSESCLQGNCDLFSENSANKPEQTGLFDSGTTLCSYQGYINKSEILNCDYIDDNNFENVHSYKSIGDGTSTINKFSFNDFLRQVCEKDSGECNICKIFIEVDLKLHAAQEHSCITYIPVHLSEIFKHHMKERVGIFSLPTSNVVYDSPSYVCRSCGFILKSIESVRLHMNIHENIYMAVNGKSSCNCDKTKFSYLQHKLKKLLLGSKYVCSFCNYYFACEYGLINHLKTSHFRLNSCLLCNVDVAHEDYVKVLAHNECHNSNSEQVVSKLITKDFIEPLRDQTHFSWNALNNHLNYLDGKTFRLRTPENIKERNIHTSLPVKVDPEYAITPEGYYLSPALEITKYLKGKLASRITGTDIDEYTSIGFDMPVQILVQKKFCSKRGRKPNINSKCKASSRMNTRFSVSSVLNLHKLHSSKHPEDHEYNSSSLRRSSRHSKLNLDDREQNQMELKLEDEEDDIALLTRTRSGMRQKENSEEVDIRHHKPKIPLHEFLTEQYCSSTEISGEWANYHTFVCCSCGTVLFDLAAIMDHKWEAHPGVWCAHTMIRGQGTVPEMFCRQYLPATTEPVVTTKKRNSKIESKSYFCTQCNGSYIKLDRFHAHLIECGGLNELFAPRKRTKNKKNLRFRRRKGQGIPSQRYANNFTAPSLPKSFDSGISTPCKDMPYQPLMRGSESAVKRRLEMVISSIEETKLKSKLQQALLSRSTRQKGEMGIQRSRTFKMKLRKKLQQKKIRLTKQAEATSIKRNKPIKPLRSSLNSNARTGKSVNSRMKISVNKGNLYDEKVSGTPTVVLRDIKHINASAKILENSNVSKRRRNKKYSWKENPVSELEVTSGEPKRKLETQHKLKQKRHKEESVSDNLNMSTYYDETLSEHIKTDKACTKNKTKVKNKQIPKCLDKASTLSNVLSCLEDEVSKEGNKNEDESKKKKIGINNKQRRKSMDISAAVSTGSSLEEQVPEEHYKKNKESIKNKTFVNKKRRNSLDILSALSSVPSLKINNSKESIKKDEESCKPKPKVKNKQNRKSLDKSSAVSSVSSIDDGVFIKRRKDMPIKKGPKVNSAKYCSSDITANDYNAKYEDRKIIPQSEVSKKLSNIKKLRNQQKHCNVAVTSTAHSLCKKINKNVTRKPTSQYTQDNSVKLNVTDPVYNLNIVNDNKNEGNNKMVDKILNKNEYNSEMVDKILTDVKSRKKTNENLNLFQKTLAQQPIETDNETHAMKLNDSSTNPISVGYKSETSMKSDSIEDTLHHTAFEIYNSPHKALHCFDTKSEKCTNENAVDKKSNSNVFPNSVRSIFQLKTMTADAKTIMKPIIPNYALRKSFCDLPIDSFKSIFEGDSSKLKDLPPTLIIKNPALNLPAAAYKAKRRNDKLRKNKFKWRKVNGSVSLPFGKSSQELATDCHADRVSDSLKIYSESLLAEKGPIYDLSMEVSNLSLNFPEKGHEMEVESKLENEKLPSDFFASNENCKKSFIKDISRQECEVDTAKLEIQVSTSNVDHLKKCCTTEERSLNLVDEVRKSISNFKCQKNLKATPIDAPEKHTNKLCSLKENAFPEHYENVADFSSNDVSIYKTSKPGKKRFTKRLKNHMLNKVASLSCVTSSCKSSIESMINCPSPQDGYSHASIFKESKTHHIFENDDKMKSNEYVQFSDFRDDESKSFLQSVNLHLNKRALSLKAIKNSSIVDLMDPPPVYIKRKRIIPGPCLQSVHKESKGDSDGCSEPEVISNFRRERFVGRVGLRKRHLHIPRYSLRPPANAAENKSLTDDEDNASDNEISTSLTDKIDTQENLSNIIRESDDDDELIVSSKRFRRCNIEDDDYDDVRSGKSGRSSLSSEDEMVLNRLKKLKEDKNDNGISIHMKLPNVDHLEGDEDIFQKDFERSMIAKSKSTPNKMGAVDKIRYLANRKFARLKTMYKEADSESSNLEELFNQRDQKKRKLRNTLSGLVCGLTKKKAFSEKKKKRIKRIGREVRSEMEKPSYDVNSLDKSVEKSSLRLVNRRRSSSSRKRKLPLTPKIVPSDCDSLSDEAGIESPGNSLTNSFENRIVETSFSSKTNCTEILGVVALSTADVTVIDFDNKSKIENVVKPLKKRWLEKKKKSTVCRNSDIQEEIVLPDIKELTTKINDSNKNCSFSQINALNEEPEIEGLNIMRSGLLKRSKRKYSFQKKLSQEDSNHFSTATSEAVRVLSYKSLNTGCPPIKSPNLDNKNDVNDQPEKVEETQMRVKKKRIYKKRCKSELDENSPTVREIKKKGLIASKMNSDISSSHLDSNCLVEDPMALFCAECGLSFDSPFSLEDHQQDCRNIAFEMSLMDEDLLFECPYCQLTFALKSTQRQHASSCRAKKSRKNSQRRRNRQAIVNNVDCVMKTASSSSVVNTENDSIEADLKANELGNNDLTKSSFSKSEILTEMTDIALRLSSVCEECPEYCAICALLYTLKLNTNDIRNLLTSSTSTSSETIIQLQSSQCNSVSKNLNTNYEMLQCILEQASCLNLPSVFQSCLRKYSVGNLFSPELLQLNCNAETNNQICISISRPELLQALSSIEELLKKAEEVQIYLKKQQMLVAMKKTFQAGTGS